MITTTTYLRNTEAKRDLLAAFSAIDHGTSAQLPPSSVDRLTLRLLVRLCALASLHGPDGPKQLLEAASLADASVVHVISELLETGMMGQAGHDRSELQQELVHFSRIVDIGADGFDMPITPGAKRIRRSHRLPESLKVLSELMVVARGRVLQRGGKLPTIWSRRPGSSRLEPADAVLAQHASGQSDHVLVITSRRRRLRLQVAYYFDCLLAYLAPMEAFATLSAYLVEMAPHEEVGVRLVWAQTPDLFHLGEFTYGPTALALSPFDAAHRLIPKTTTLVNETESAPTVVVLEEQRGRLFLQTGIDGVLVTHETADGKRAAIGRAASSHPTVKTHTGSLVGIAVETTVDHLAAREVRSIECGHIHLDRQIDQDQEVGAGIGVGVYHLLKASQAEPPLLTPMMDDDHVLVKLRPAQYVAFLRGTAGDVPFRLIPESSPIVRAIAVALYVRVMGRVPDRLVRRGDNLFLRLADGTFCELFEDVDGAAVSGCVLFEVALLVYRSDPDAFDTYVNARYPGHLHVHSAAEELLDNDEPHDHKVERLTELYSRYAALTDPNSPDPEFTTLVGKVLERHGDRRPIVHLNILEDYYEVQQGKVRQLIADLDMPIQLVTCHFNTQTGRIAMVG